MQHVVTRPPPPLRTADGALEIHQLPAARDNLVWGLVCNTTGAAAVVDGPDASAALAWCAANELTLTAVLNTHTHPDHVGLNRDLIRRGALSGVRVYGPRGAAEGVPGLTDPVGEGDSVHVGAAQGEVLLTEGHMDGHVSFRFSDAVFCGDTLFTGGCGYLFDGPPSKMHASLQRLASLDGGTRVCCAHEYSQDNLRFAWTLEPDNPALAARIRAVWRLRRAGASAVPSTVEVERATNPFLRGDQPTIRARLAELMPDHPQRTAREIFAATRALKDTGRHRRLPDAALPLLIRG